jgi:hypothetical protein
MNAIQSLYIPHIDKHISAQYIANAFEKNRIAQVSRVFIEPHKYVKTNYNRAYILIDSWIETEAAYNFVKKLRNPKTEARLVHSDDDWWKVDINKKETKLYRTDVLTIFKMENEDAESTYKEVKIELVQEDEADEIEYNEDNANAEESVANDVVNMEDGEPIDVEFNDWFDNFILATKLIGTPIDKLDEEAIPDWFVSVPIYNVNEEEVPEWLLDDSTPEWL